MEECKWLEGIYVRTQYTQNYELNRLVGGSLKTLDGWKSVLLKRLGGKEMPKYSAGYFVQFYHLSSASFFKTLQSKM